MNADHKFDCRSNLRMDPYERTEITSNRHYAWMLKKGFLAEAIN